MEHPVRLRAHWIWCEGEEAPKNFYLYCRRVFTVDGAASSATLHLTADSRYKLFVNGTFVARGPARCDPRWQIYDTVDILPFLRPGENVIAVLVHHLGVHTHSYLLGRGGFYLEGDVVSAGTTVTLDTGPEWRVLPSPAWKRDVPRGTFAIMWEEIFDARREPAGWMTPGFDDANWHPPVVLGKPPVKPWEHLVPREIPFLREEELWPVAILDSGLADPAPYTARLDLTTILNARQRGNVAYVFAYVHSPVAQQASIAPRGRYWPIPRHVWMNGVLYGSEANWQDGAIKSTLVEFPLEEGWNELLLKVGRDDPEWVLDITIGPGEGVHLTPVSLRAQPDLASPPDTVWVVGPFEGARAHSGKEGFHTPYEFEELVLGRVSGATLEIPGEEVSLQFEPGNNIAVNMDMETRDSGADAGFLDLDALLDPHAGPTHVVADAAVGSYVALDFGRIVSGYVRVRVNGVAGGVIDLGYSEVLQDGHVYPSRGKLCYADRYIMRDGPQTFELFWYKGFRYLQATFRNCPLPVEIDGITVNFTSYPVEYRGAFATSDPLLDRIWETGRWTLQLCMHDGYEDTPWREQGQWCGDAEVEILGNFLTFGDVPLARKCLLQIAQGQEEDGNLPMMYPARTHVIPHGIPTFVAQYVSMVNAYHLYTGERATTDALYPCITRAMGYFDQFLADDGLLAEVVGFPFLDWMLEPDVMPVFGKHEPGKLTGMNCLYYRALLDAAALADLQGDAARAVEWRGKAQRVGASVNEKLWDATLQVYRHGIIDGKAIERIAVHDTILAVFSGVASLDRGASAMDTLAANTRLNPVVIGSPYFEYFHLGALRRLGRHAQAIDVTRRMYGMMLEEGATAWWEQYNQLGSWSHAWSCAPSSDLSLYVLGVQPLEPGFAAVRIAPERGPLSHASGIVPTVKGDIKVDWTLNHKFQLDATVPFAASVELCIPADDASSAVQTAGATAIRSDFRDGKAVFVVQGPGRFSVEAEYGSE